jgi:2-methylisocitrate lyase-like PEP mutase family enzyme
MMVVVGSGDREGESMKVTQENKAARFRDLHEGPGAFITPNPWDIGSARLLAGLGFPALATSRRPQSAVFLGSRGR